MALLSTVFTRRTKKNVNNLRYADDTALTVESEKELKSLFCVICSVVSNSLWLHGL